MSGMVLKEVRGLGKGSFFGSFCEDKGRGWDWEIFGR